MTRYEVVLGGCTPQPLSSYLTGLGVVRVIAEQVDAQASAWWASGGLVVRSMMDDAGIAAFFRDEFRPSPIVSPWNKGSGFGGSKNPSAVAALKTVEESSLPRLSVYRETIALARSIYAEATTREWDKGHIVEECRSRFPEEALGWLDAAVLVDSEHKPLPMPPLLGSGGNDGRLEFSVAFLSRLADALGLIPARSAKAQSAAQKRRADWLQEALFGTATDPVELLRGETSGYFRPGRVGGVNASSDGPADALVNPWSWVLTMEGTLLFASSVARRLGSSRGGLAAAPFTVKATAAGYASASEEEARASRGEIWCPLWERPAGAGEIARLIGEGRAQWRGAQARTGLDFARAAVSLGVDRGISQFMRHVLVARNGRSMLAVPVGFVRVNERPAVHLTAKLDPWLDRIRAAKNPPASVTHALHRLDAALFALTQRDRADGLLQVLVAAARLERVVSQSGAMRSQTLPVKDLLAKEWRHDLGVDSAPELRVAAVLASAHDPFVRGQGMSLRTLLRPVVRPAPQRGASRAWQWTDQPPVPGLGTAPLLTLLAAVLTRRCLEVARRAETQSAEDAVSDVVSVVGIRPAFARGLVADLADVESLLAGQLDLQRLGDALEALLLLDWDVEFQADEVAEAGARGRERTDPCLIPPAAAAVLPWFHRPALKRQTADGSAIRYGLTANPSWPALLATDRASAVARDAARRARALGLGPIWGAGPGAGEVWAPERLGQPLAAACLLRLSGRSVAFLLDRVAPWDRSDSRDRPAAPDEDASPGSATPDAEVMDSGAPAAL